MDESNFNELQVMADLAGKKCKAKVELLGSYLLDKGEEIIKDPFFVSFVTYQLSPSILKVKCSQIQC